MRLYRDLATVTDCQHHTHTHTHAWMEVWGVGVTSQCCKAHLGITMTRRRRRNMTPRKDKEALMNDLLSDLLLLLSHDQQTRRIL